MKTFLTLLLALWLPLSAFAATGSGNVSNVYTNGGLTIPTSDIVASSTAGNRFTLIGGGSPGAANFSVLAKEGTAYQVPSGKTAVCDVLNFSTSDSTNSFQIVTATAAITRGSGTITGGVYETGAAAFYAHHNSTNYQTVAENVLYKFPQNVFVGWQAQGGAAYYTIKLSCREL